MNNFDRLFEYLENDKEKRNEIETLAAEDVQISEFLKFCEDVRNLGSELHPDYEMIADYIVYEDQFTDGTTKQTINLTGHLQTCSECAAIYRELKAEYNEVEFREELPVFNIESAPKAAVKNRFNFLRSYPLIRYAVAASVFLVIGWVGLALYSSVSMPLYKKIAGYNPAGEISQVRGRSNSYFDRALSEITNQNYNKAIALLNEDVTINSNDKTIFYTHYVIGLLYLSKSERSVLGVMKNYNTDDLKNAVKEFETVIAKNKSGKFDNVTFDSYYYIGKAFLLLDDKPNAEKYLKLVIVNRGSFMDESHKLLDLIN